MTQSVVSFDLLTPTRERQELADSLVEEIHTRGLAFVGSDSRDIDQAQTPRDWLIGRIRETRLGKEAALQLLDVLAMPFNLGFHLEMGEVPHISSRATGQQEAFRDPELAQKVAHWVVCPQYCRTRPMAAYAPVRTPAVAKLAREAIPPARVVRQAGPAPRDPYWDEDYRKERGRL